MIDYDKVPGIRWSHLKMALSSALALEHVMKGRSGSSPAQRLGIAIHAYVLDRESFSKHRVICPAEYVTASGAVSTGAKARAYLADNVGEQSILVTRQEMDLCEAIDDALEQHPVARAALAGATERETIHTWDEVIDGRSVKCKCKVDAYDKGEGILWDLKSYGGRAPFSVRTCINEIAHRLYHAQLGFYSRAPLVSCDRFGWLFVQSHQPFDVCVLEADDDMVANGKETAEKALHIYADALKRGMWEGCAPARVVASLPGWMFEPDDNDVAEELGLTMEGD